MSRTDVGANLDSSFRKSATIIRELACTGLIPDQRFNRQLVPSGPARRNSGNARIKTSGVARHKIHRQDGTLLMVQNMIIVGSREDLASRSLRREVSASFRLLVHEAWAGPVI